MNRKLRNILGVVLTGNVFVLGGTAGVQPAFAADASYAGASCNAGSDHKVDSIPGALANTSTTKTLFVACPHATDPNDPSLYAYVNFDKHNNSDLTCTLKSSDWYGVNTISSPQQVSTGIGNLYFYFSTLNGNYGQFYITCTLPKATSSNSYSRINATHFYD